MINNRLWLVLLLAGACEGVVSEPLESEVVSSTGGGLNGNSSGRGGGGGARADGAGGAGAGSAGTGGGASSAGGGSSGDGATGGGADSAGGGTAGAGGGEASDGAGLPCDVSALLESTCSGCHGSTGPQIRLTTRADLTAASFVPGQTVGQRAAQLMGSTSNPMPPAGSPAPTSAEVATFDSWVSSGMPAGTCGSADAGTLSPADAGVPAPVPVCTSGTSWTGGNRGSGAMNPGQPCVQCHRAKGANRELFVFAGTVYPSLHEKDLCQGKPPSDVRVEIYDKNGALALTMTPDSTSGNFHSSTSASVAMPYTAKVVSSKGTATMKGPQMNGDCNVCHTVLGTTGAPGRVTWGP